jgi:hypothetical protein
LSGLAWEVAFSAIDACLGLTFWALEFFTSVRMLYVLGLGTALFVLLYLRFRP